MSITGVLGLAKIGMELIDRFVSDPDENRKAKVKLLEMESNGELKRFMSAAGIVEAEASSEHWLTAMWRPITMLVLVGLVVSYWMGFTPENLPPAQVEDVLDIVKIGLGGYVISRGGEKIAKTVYGKEGEK